jgi:hypothetical protein
MEHWRAEQAQDSITPDMPGFGIAARVPLYMARPRLAMPENADIRLP